MNKKYEQFAAVSKIETFKQYKRGQTGLKLGYNEAITDNSNFYCASSSIPISTNDFSLELYINTYGSRLSTNSTVFNNKQKNVYQDRSLFIYNNVLNTNGVSWVLFSKPSIGYNTADSVLLNWEAPTTTESFHLVISRQEKIINIYINGELLATKEQSTIKNLGEFELSFANSLNIGLARIFNYPLTANEVVTLYNNGNPINYTLPNNMKNNGNNSQYCIAEYIPQNIISRTIYIGPSITPVQPVYEFNLDSPYYYPVILPQSYEFECIYRVDYTVNEFSMDTELQKTCGFLCGGGATWATPFNNKYGFREDQIGIPQYLHIVVKPNTNPTLYIYGGYPNSEMINRHLKVTINKVTAVNNIAIKWLDSANQLPYNDQYLPPLLESINGYDMVCYNGPQIIYDTEHKIDNE